MSDELTNPRDGEELATTQAAQDPPVALQTPRGMPNFAVGLSLTNAEAEVIKRVTSEHISQEMTNGHQRALRALELQEKTIAGEEAERIREHERDQRDRTEQRASDSRIERMFYIVFGSVMILTTVLVLKDTTDLAIKLVAAFGAILLANCPNDRYSRGRRRLQPRCHGTSFRWPATAQAGVPPGNHNVSYCAPKNCIACAAQQAYKSRA